MSKIKNLFNQAHYQKFEEEKLKTLFKTKFQGKSLLDIGCGQGRYLRLLQEYCTKIKGIDANPDQVKNLLNEGFDASLPNEPLQQKYDVLLMSHIVEHLSAQELVAFIDKYLPSLEDDGYLIILTPLPGIRFWHDYTHIRPYTPQSLGMLFGIIGAPAAFRSKNKMNLEEIHFFRDSWRIRNNKYYFPFHTDNESIFTKTFRNMIFATNVIFAKIYILSNGKAGTLASWMGIYRNINTTTP